MALILLTGILKKSLIYLQNIQYTFVFGANDCFPYITMKYVVTLKEIEKL